MRVLCLAATFMAVAWPVPLRAEAPLTLEAALAEASAHNLRLPVAEMDVAASEQQARAARGARLPRLSIESTFQVSPPGFSYGAGGASSIAGEERLQLVGRETVYDGGALGAQVSGADAQIRSSRAVFRILQKDLDLEVRTRFSELAKAQDDVAAQEQALERLQVYLGTIRARQAAGEGLESDLLKTQVRLSGLDAELEEGRRKLRAGQLLLGDLLGRDPGPPVSVSPSSALVPAATFDGSPWQGVPELVQVEADLAAAQANVEVARSARRPHLDLLGDAGILGGGLAGDVPSAPLGSRLSNDLGASLTISVSWPFLDFGIFQGQLGQAQARAEQARRRIALQRRDARLRWETAMEDERRWYRQVRIREQAVPLARDAYLIAASLYRGGSGTALDVLDAFSSLLAAAQSYSDAVLSFRIAEATALRWGSP
jgi:outer membrane protein TolC